MTELLPEGWLLLSQAAELTGYSKKQLYRLAQGGQVEAKRLGTWWVFNRESLLGYQATARRGRKPRKTTE